MIQLALYSLITIAAFAAIATVIDSAMKARRAWMYLAADLDRLSERADIGRCRSQRPAARTYAPRRGATTRRPVRAAA